MAIEYLEAQASRCPDQKFVLSGYSKGAIVIHSTKLSNEIQAKIFSILVFGDPLRNTNPSWPSPWPKTWPINTPKVNLAPRDGRTTAQNIASFCNTGDPVCEAGGTNGNAHVAYRTDGSAPAAADFVKAQVQEGNEL